MTIAVDYDYDYIVFKKYDCNYDHDYSKMCNDYIDYDYNRNQT